MTYRGQVKNGVVVLEESTRLAEGTRVRVQPLKSPAKKKANGKSLGQRLMKFAGSAKGLPADMAKNHDHYIHGARQEMNWVFADTFYYLALLNPADEAHPRAREFTAGFDGKILTTEWILTELADGLSGKATRSVVIAFIDSHRFDPAVRIIPPGRKLLDRGWELYRRRADKEWSLTDRFSFVVMRRFKLMDALTADHHFAQAGFRPLLAPPAS